MHQVHTFLYNAIVLIHVVCKQTIHMYDLIQGPTSDIACLFFFRYSPFPILIDIQRISEGHIRHTTDSIHIQVYVFICSVTFLLFCLIVYIAVHKHFKNLIVLYMYFLWCIIILSVFDSWSFNINSKYVDTVKENAPFIWDPFKGNKMLSNLRNWLHGKTLAPKSHSAKDQLPCYKPTWSPGKCTWIQPSRTVWLDFVCLAMYKN